jgi:cyclic beta-1,2-glucan synthetase
MLASERFLFLNNFFNLLVPIFQVSGLFFLMWYGVEELSLASFFFLLPSFTPLFNEILRASFHGSLLNILRKFFGDTLTALCRESIMLGYRLSSLAFIAYKNADAVIRSLWRMKVSGKKLLEWTTASQGEGSKNSLVNTFAYTFPSFVLGVFVLSFARLSLCRLLGILWCIYFVIVYQLDKPIASKGFTHAQKKLLTRWAGDIWKYFDRYVD